VFLASLLLLTFPTSFDLQETENFVRMKMIVAAARFVSVSQAQDYTDYILQAGRFYGMSPTLLLALFITESELDYRARSPKGYAGIAQTPRMLPPYQSILEGGRILREKMIEADTVEEAVGAYKGFGFVTNAHTRKVMRLKKEIERL